MTEYVDKVQRMNCTVLRGKGWRETSIQASLEIVSLHRSGQDTYKVIHMYTASYQLYKEESAVQWHHHLHPPIAQVQIKKKKTATHHSSTEMESFISLAFLAICIFSPACSAPANPFTIFHPESGRLVRATTAGVVADGINGGEYHWL